MRLPASAAAAFRLAAAELGMCSAARLFTKELHDAGGVELLDAAREELGAEFPVLDLVATRAASSPSAAWSAIDPENAVLALRDPASVLVVGLEAFFLDALVPALPNARVGLVLGEGGMEGDERRIAANFDERVALVKLGDVQRWAGRKSALFTFAYGSNGPTVHVSPLWLRVAGSDVRAQFRTLAAWDVLGQPTPLYPRWFVETPSETFSRIVSA